MGFMSIFKKSKKEVINEDDLIFQETVKEVLGIELKHTGKRESFSMAYDNGLTALAIEMRLRDPSTKSKFEEVYNRKK